ncbi:MAG: HEAT repeat domain-containing protein [Dehalogenimonas sp.]
MTTPTLRTSPEEPSFESVIKKLVEKDEKLTSSEIAALSLAEPEERVLFRRYWPEVPAERKAHLLGRMVELAEDDANLDFSSLYRIMLGDDTPVVRTAAIQGLWENEDPSLIRKLMPMMQSDPDAGVRAAAAEALGRFSMLAEYGKLSPEAAETLSKSLLSVFEDSGEDIDVRRRALEAASYLSRPEVREAITDAYDSDDPGLRASALFAAGRNLDPSWLETLLDETVSELPELRYEAAVALGEYEDERGVPQLIRLTEDDDAEVRMAAITALGKVGGRDAKRQLEELTHSEDEAVREIATESLEDLSETSQLLSGEIEAPHHDHHHAEELEDWDEETYAG